jgi:hypothetical protein
MGQLFAREQLLFHPVGYWRNALAGEPYPQSPLLLILLRPLLALPVMNAYLVMACVLIVSILGTLALLQHLYPASGAVRRICLLAVSPPCFMGVHDGQIDALLLLALTAALLAIESRRFALAGMLVSVGLVKPNICLGAIILMLFLARLQGGARRYVLGLTGSTLVCVVLWSVVGGIETSRHWLQGIAYFSAHIAGSMASDPSLTTLYGGWSSRISTPAVLLALCAWLGTMVLLWRRCTSPDKAMCGVNPFHRTTAAPHTVC